MPSLNKQTTPVKTAGNRAKSVNRSKTGKQRAETPARTAKTVNASKKASQKLEKAGSVTYFTGRNHWTFVKGLLGYVALSSFAALYLTYMEVQVFQGKIESDLSTASDTVTTGDKNRNLNLNESISNGTNATVVEETTNTTNGTWSNTTANATQNATNATLPGHSVHTTETNTTTLNATQRQWRDEHLTKLQLDLATFRNKVLEPMHASFRNFTLATKPGKETHHKIQKYLTDAFQLILEQEDSYATTAAAFDDEKKPLLFRLRKTLRAMLQNAKQVGVKQAIERVTGVTFDIREECNANAGHDFLDAPKMNAFKLDLALDAGESSSDKLRLTFEQVNACSPIANVSVSFTPVKGARTVTVNVGEL